MNAIYTNAQRVAIGAEFFSTTTAAAEQKVLAKYGSTIVRRGLAAFAAKAEDAKVAEQALAYRDDIPTNPGQEGYVVRPTKPAMPAGVDTKVVKAKTPAKAKSTKAKTTKAPAKSKAKATTAKGKKPAAKKQAVKVAA